MMRSSEIISLFEAPSVPRRAPSAFVVSILIHGAAFSMLWYGILFNPRINDQIVTERYTVRRLDLHAAEARAGDPSEGSIEYPGPLPSPHSQASSEKPDTSPAILRQLPTGAAGPQTLVQPEFHSHVALQEEAPVPTIVIWTPELAPSKKIVAPLPDKATAADVKPSLDEPNEELKLAEISVATTDVPMRAQAIPPGTTSPITQHARALAQLPPVTVSNSSEQPTPTAVLSISDIRMPEGTVTLPPVNQTHHPAPSKTPEPVQAKTTPPASKGSQNNPASGSRAGPAPGNGHGNPTAAGDAARQNGTGQVATARVGAAQFATMQEGTEHITLPGNGQFGVVVVGTSLAEEYPETLQIWNDRVAYTVYLHVGLSKNWILQYSLVRSAESAAGGMVARLEAPWPYDIVRPNLVSRELNADALMVHGFVSETGRFESIAVAFPAHYAHADFVLNALEQWQFRPARQNGKATAVEVLLIIPDEME